MSVYSEVQRQEIAVAVAPLVEAAERARIRAEERWVRVLASHYPLFSEIRNHLVDHHGCPLAIVLDMPEGDTHARRERLDRLHYNMHS